MTAKAAAKRREGKGGGVVPLLIDVVVDDGGRSSFAVDVSFVPSLCPPPLDPQTAVYAGGATRLFESGIRSLFVDVVDEDGRHRIATLWCYERKEGRS